MQRYRGKAIDRGFYYEEQIKTGLSFAIKQKDIISFNKII